MTSGKKSFIIYTDLIYQIDHLTNEEKGLLFQHLLDYVNDKQPVLNDRVLLSVWKPIQMQLKRDLKLWEDKQNQRSKAGLRSAEVRRQKQTTVNDRSICSTKPTVNVNGNVNVSTKVDEEKNDTSEIIKIYNDFKDEIKRGEHNMIVESWLINLGISKKGLEESLIKGFKTQLLTDNKKHKNTLELRKHFHAYLNKINSLGKLDNYKNRTKGML